MINRHPLHADRTGVPTIAPSAHCELIAAGAPELPPGSGYTIALADGCCWVTVVADGLPVAVVQVPALEATLPSVVAAAAQAAGLATSSR